MFHFVDYVTVNMVCFLMLIGNSILFGRRYLDMPLEEIPQEGFGFAAPGFILTLLGGDMVLHWPLHSSVPTSGNANIIIGWPSLIFGVLFLFSGLAIVLCRGKAALALKPLARCAFFGGLMLVAIAGGILITSAGSPPPTESQVIRMIFGPVTWAIVYISSGIVAILSPWALSTQRKVLRSVVLVALFLAGGLLAVSTVGTLISHIQLFGAFPA